MRIAENVHHIVTDDRGVAWIKDTNLKLIELVREHLAYGWSADELQEQHPYLTLGEVHASLAFFYDHQKEIEAQMETADTEYSRLRAMTGEAALQGRLQALSRGGWSQH
jgi:uncharacterized protein (DUF433 family)